MITVHVGRDCIGAHVCVELECTLCAWCAEQAPQDDEGDRYDLAAMVGNAVRHVREHPADAPDAHPWRTR